MVRLELMREAAVEKYIAERRSKENPTENPNTLKETYSDEQVSQISNDSVATPKRGKKNNNNNKVDIDEEKKMPASSKNAGNEK